MRPVLSAATRRLWRDQHTLQLGRSQDRAVILAGVDAPTRAVLGLLDGTRDVPAVLRAAAELGCPQERARELLDLLADAGLVLDAAVRWPERLSVDDRDRLSCDLASLTLLNPGRGVPVLHRRDAASVLVLGGGRVGASLAALLAAAGVGNVDVTDHAPARPWDSCPGGLGVTDSGRPRSAAARDRLKQVCPTVRTVPVARPDLVVLAPTTAVEDPVVHALERDGIGHLVAEVRDTVGVVGPMVLPGRSTCLRCLDLARTERDPDWPVVAAQLATPVRASPPCDVVLAAAVAAQAALQVLTLLDGGQPASVDGCLEMALPDWRWRRRSWGRHPACECRWAATG